VSRWGGIGAALAALSLVLVQFTSVSGAPVAVNPEAVEAVFVRPGHHSEMRLLSGAIVDVSEDYDDVVRKLRAAPAP
jgi:uncharacterized protein YlzI (FlbEa/FlbD family)